MTKMHFIGFANAVKSINNVTQRQIVLDFLLSILPSFNSKFDATRFKDWVNK